MPSPSISIASLGQHLDTLERVLQRRTLGHEAISLSREEHRGALIAGLSGAGTELVERNRGRGSVAPMFELGGDGLRAWLGLRTEWRRVPKGKRLSFHDISMTIHLGYSYRRPKPQIFRMEWSAQPEDAGQPHWQFDALESVEREHAQRDRLGDLSQSEATDENSHWLEPEDVVMVVRGMSLSSIHFASAAAWWQNNSAHFHAPKSTTDIESWVDRTLEYTQLELGRLRRS